MPLPRRRFLQTIAFAGAAAALPAQQREAHIHGELQKALVDAPLALRFDGDGAEECRAWQGRFRAKLAELLGPHQPPAEWRSTVEAKTDFDDHSRQTLLLEADGYPLLPLHLLLPKGGGKRPGILALHGHGPFGNDAVAGIDNTPERAADIAKFNYDYGRQLARRGYVVVTPCFQPFGRRLDSKDAYGSDACAVSFVRLQLLGRTLIGENLRDALWSYSLLRGLPQVDPNRIGCVGLSYGGRMTMLTAAMEPRIRVAVPSGALNVMQERAMARYSCGAQVIPGLLQYGDVPEIGGLIAPRPALWEVGTRDGLMVKDWIGPAWERMERVYSALGASDQLNRDDFDGAHRWNGVKAYPLLDHVLKGSG